MKTCTKCNETKYLHDFRKKRNSKGEMVAISHCKTCENAYSKAWRRKNASKSGLSRKDYYNSLRLPAKLSDRKDLLAKGVKTIILADCHRCRKMKRVPCIDFTFLLQKISTTLLPLITSLKGGQTFDVLQQSSRPLLLIIIREVVLALPHQQETHISTRSVSSHGT